MVDNIDDYVEYSIGKPVEGVEMKIVDENKDTNLLMKKEKSS